MKQLVFYSCLVLVVGVLTGCSSMGSSTAPANTSYAVSTAPKTVPNRRAMLPPPQIEMNSQVTKLIKHYTTRERGTILKTYERQQPYIETIEEIFLDEGIPAELINVARIESGFRPEVKSYAGAVGLWQFMRSTATVYGLEVSKTKDERKDPIRSTLAAARHLRDLYNAFGNWNLALAAYNAGSGTVDKAINRSRTRDFWELSKKNRFKAQTKKYVTKFQAITVIMSDPAAHGFYEIAAPEITAPELDTRQAENHLFPVVSDKA